jgi:outer membrane autotransporter protein
LNLAGGSQTVTGNIGTQLKRLGEVNSGKGSTLFTGNVISVSVSNMETGTSNFAADVTANTINVNGGISNFTNDVTATTTNIGTGVGNFNTNGAGTTATAIVFTADRTQTATPSVLGSATANLITGLTGNIDFSSKDAVVNVSENQAIIGAVTSTGATAKDGKNGALNFLGGGAISGNIGSSLTTGISQLNVNTAGVIANTVAVGGNIYAESINLKNNGVLTLAAGKNIVGTTATTLTGAQQTITTDVAHTGTLTLEGDVQNVTGVVGANDAAIAQVNAGVNGAVTTFNNMVFADTLAFAGYGRVVLNGQAGVDAATAGVKGTVDFGVNGYGELQIGDNVNLTTGATGVQMTNAGDATLTFNGTSTVTGVVGGDTSGRSTLRTIQAGVTDKAVTFKNDVYVSEAAEPTTFHITGDGTVNFQGNLHGQLVFNNGADGTVNVSNTKSLIVTTAVPAAVSASGHEGTINFLGGTTLSSDLGTLNNHLKAVNFNTATNNITQTIDKNVFADTVTIGGTAGTTAISKVDVTGAYDYAGANSMFTFAGGTTANISNVTSLPDSNITLGGNLVIANATTAVNFGVAHVSTGNVITNGGAMSFTVNTTDIGNGGSAVSASDGSGQVTAAGALTMTGAEKVHVNYVGSLKQAGTYALITSASGTDKNLGNEGGAKVSDNSFSIDTSVAQSSSGSLILTADRTAGATYAANQNYIQKAGTMGDFSNNAGMMLGGIAAAGSQTGDMVQVIQKLELDSFGFGNTADKLATQVKRLAPVANASVTQSSLAASGLSLNAVGVRMAALRGDTKLASSDVVTGLSAGDAVASNGFWVKALGSSNSQDKQGAYDGYSSKITGVTAGLDNRVNADFVLGAALGLAKADINQADFRTGDTNRINNTQLMGYGTYSLTNELYLDGALSFARNDYTGIRATAVGRTASSAFNGNQMGARLGLGYGIDLGSKLKLTPMASVDYSRLTQDAYTETGASAINLAVDAQSTNNTRLGLGARLSNEWTEGSTTYRPEVALNWSQNSNSISNDVNAAFVGGGVGFVTPGTTAVSRNSVNLGVAMTVLSSKTSSIQIRYDLDKSTGFTANTGSLLARWEY